jgi:hypothetical protein
MATKNIGIQNFEIVDRAHDPRGPGEVNAFREQLDDCFQLIDASGSNAGYLPISASHWVDPDPTTVKQAVDRMARMIFLGLTGSILP